MPTFYYYYYKNNKELPEMHLGPKFYATISFSGDSGVTGWAPVVATGVYVP